MAAAGRKARARARAFGALHAKMPTVKETTLVAGMDFMVRIFEFARENGEKNGDGYVWSISRDCTKRARDAIFGLEILTLR